MKRARAGIVAALVAALLVGQPGCAFCYGLYQSEFYPYSGLIEGVEFWKKGPGDGWFDYAREEMGGDAFCAVVILQTVDLLLTFVLDTGVLPASFIAWLLSDNAEAAKTPAEAGAEPVEPPPALRDD